MFGANEQALLMHNYTGRSDISACPISDESSMSEAPIQIPDRAIPIGVVESEIKKDKLFHLTVTSDQYRTNRQYKNYDYE